MAKNEKERGPATSVLEWIAAAVGLLIALAMLGIIAWDAFTGQGDPVPDLSVEVTRLVPTATGHVVEFEVANSSDQTAASVQVEAQLGGGAQPVTAGATIDYVPGHAKVVGGVIFPDDPRGKPFQLRVTGFEIP